MKRIIWIFLFLLVAVPSFGQTQRHVAPGYIYYTTGIPAITTDFQVQGRITAGPTLQTDITDQYDIITYGCVDVVSASSNATAGALCVGGSPKVVSLSAGATGNGLTGVLTFNIQNPTPVTGYDYEAVRILGETDSGGGTFLQFTQSYNGAALSVAGTVALRNNNGVLQSSQNGAAWANLTGGGGSSYWSRNAIVGGLYALEPVTSPTDNVLLGLTATDIGQSSAIGTSGGLFSISASTAASVGGFGTIANGAVDVVSFHTPGGTTLPIQIVFDSSAATAKFTPGGGMVIGNPTGGDQGTGTLNVATGIFIAGIPVGSGGSTSATWTFLSGYLYPVSTSEVVVNGASTIGFASTSTLAGSIVSIKPSSQPGGFYVASGTSASANYASLTATTTAEIITANFGSGGALKPFEFLMGATQSAVMTTSGDWTFGSFTDLGYTLGVNGTLGVTGAIVSTATSIAAISVAAGNGFALGSFVALAESSGDLNIYTEVSGSRTQTVTILATGIDVQVGGVVVAGATGGYEGSGTVNATAYYINGVALTGGVGGSGTIGAMPYFSGTTTLANSPLLVSGGNLTTGASIISTANTSTVAFSVIAGNGYALGSYEAIYNDVGDTGLVFDAKVSGSRATVAVMNASGLSLNSGLLLGSATGGFQGAGTVNATAYYINGSLLSSGIGGSGSTGSFAGFSGSTTLTNAPMTFSGSAVTASGTIAATGQISAYNLTATNGGVFVIAGEGFQMGNYESVTGNGADTGIITYVNNGSGTSVSNGLWTFNNLIMGGVSPSTDSNASNHPQITVISDSSVGGFKAVSGATNASTMNFAVSVSTSQAIIVSGRTTSGGTFLPIAIFAGGSQVANISTAGAWQFNKYGAGALTTDGSGNITASSDERLKLFQRDYMDGLDAVMKIHPVVYKWRPESGMETEGEYAGFFAQNVRDASALATGQNPNGYLTLQDRAILAMIVNAIKEQQGEINSLKSKKEQQ